MILNNCQIINVVMMLFTSFQHPATNRDDWVNIAHFGMDIIEEEHIRNLMASRHIAVLVDGSIEQEYWVKACNVRRAQSLLSKYAPEIYSGRAGWPKLLRFDFAGKTLDEYNPSLPFDIRKVMSRRPQVDWHKMLLKSVTYQQRGYRGKTHWQQAYYVDIEMVNPLDSRRTYKLLSACFTNDGRELVWSPDWAISTRG